MVRRCGGHAGRRPAGHRNPCKINVHLLGHSTGAYVIMEAFSQAGETGSSVQGGLARRAGSADRRRISRPSRCARAANGRARCSIAAVRLTNYSNRQDKVLGVSNAKRLGTSPRVGRVARRTPASQGESTLTALTTSLTKDPATSKFNGTFNHSWHVGDPVFALDLTLTLEGEMDACRCRRESAPVLCGSNGRAAFQRFQREASGRVRKPGRPTCQE